MQRPIAPARQFPVISDLRRINSLIGRINFAVLIAQGIGNCGIVPYVSVIKTLLRRFWRRIAEKREVPCSFPCYLAIRLRRPLRMKRLVVSLQQGIRPAAAWTDPIHARRALASVAPPPRNLRRRRGRRRGQRFRLQSPMGAIQSDAIRRCGGVISGSCHWRQRSWVGRGLSSRRPNRRLFGLSARQACVRHVRRATRRPAA